MPDAQQQSPPGTTAEMRPQPDHGERSYRGSGRLAGRRTLITGADSGIGRAVAIAFAREGADVVISYLEEHEDARETARWVEEAGRTAVVVPGDLSDPAHCRELVARTVAELGGIDVLVSNAAYQMTHETLEEVSDEEWDHTIATNLSALFHLTKAALPHMGPGASIIATSSVNSDSPKPTLLPYAVTKGAIANFTAGLAQLVGDRGIRVNSVAPGPIWTPLIPSTMPPDQVEEFGGTRRSAAPASRRSARRCSCSWRPTRGVMSRAPASPSPGAARSSEPPMSRRGSAGHTSHDHERRTGCDA